MVSVCSVVSPWGPMDCSPLGSSGQWILQQEYRSGLTFPSPVQCLE